MSEFPEKFPDNIHPLQRRSLKRQWEALRRKGKRGGGAVAVDSRFERAWEEAADMERRRREGIAKPTFPDDLPITAHVNDIREALEKNQVIVVAGETGSGKTTQLPKICVEAGLAEQGNIVCTQPRRVAALSISQRIAEELGVEYGQEVGAKIRFTDRTSDRTFLKIVTDGMLLTEIEHDPELHEYSTVILDEAHERSLNIDFLIGYLVALRKRRPELKIIITSATIDTKTFSEHFGGAPIIEVSGRTYPVDVQYMPLDEQLEDSGEFTYIDGIVKAVEDILAWNRPGDVLVFLPGEKDIRETRDILEKQGYSRLEILPLFGRLSNAEQARIFSSSRNRKIILATNIAETSITIPGIRYVIDTGLARISRYSPQTHTQRLPIEKISQSSADQRKGRAGRVAEGVCIRLYDEKVYQERPKYSTPEILRSNLASVILRMEAFRLGRIEEFPFIEKPNPKSIEAGYQLLRQLKAIDEDSKLTPLGKKIARIPVDPTVAKMLLHAREEGALREVLVIAAGLSIQDPREVPMDEVEKAREMHKKFINPESDFLTLLKLWDAFHDKMESLSQSQLRKFCRSHYLSYIRMREWRDIHQQLVRILKDLRALQLNRADAEYHQVHRALLSGLLSGIAQKSEGNEYRAPFNRKVHLFPGSVLFDRAVAKRERKKKYGKPLPNEKPQSKTPPWILAGEWVETQRLYARTVAGIKPEWILDLGAHLCHFRYTDSRYDEKREAAVVRERTLIYGLEIRNRWVGLTKQNPKEATEIFVREGLVGGRMQTSLPFKNHNDAVREEAEQVLARFRTGSTWEIEERLNQFYLERLSSVGSIGDLNSWLKENHGGDDRVLRVSKEVLLGEMDGQTDINAFPSNINLDHTTLPVDYQYRPGEEEDGATLKVPVEEFNQMSSAVLDWAVPGYVREKIEHLLRSLPKDTRRHLFPLADTAHALSRQVSPDHGALVDQLVNLLNKHFGIRVFPNDFDPQAIPEHLRTRVEVLNDKEEVVASGRDWRRVNEAYRHAVEEASRSGEGNDNLRVWQQAREKYERDSVSDGKPGTFAASLRIGDLAGVPIYAFPGLKQEGDHIALRLFVNESEARKHTIPAFHALCRELAGRDLGWLQKDLKQELKRVTLDYQDLMSSELLFDYGFNMICRYIFATDKPFPVDENELNRVLAQSRERMKGIVPQFVDLLASVGEARARLRPLVGKSAGWNAELKSLIHPQFLKNIRYERLQCYPRYLKALELRIKRAQQNPQKDREKANKIIPLVRRFAEMRKDHPQRGRIRWLIEEYKVQVFAQELGTVEKVSEKKLEGLLGNR